MIEVSKREKEIIANAIPSVHYVRTMKRKSKRHHYYFEESAQVLKVLNRLRNKTHQKGGVKDGLGETK